MISFPAPNQQIDFSVALAAAKHLYLQDALGRTIESLPLRVVDKQLDSLAAASLLAALARHGLRGELVFVVPVVLETNPKLLAYYRLILGYSQKEFFSRATGASGFKLMETSGKLSKFAAGNMRDLCKAMNSVAAELVRGIGAEKLSKQLLHDLSLLTLGPQLRGGANVRRGDAAIGKVFDLIRGIVKNSVTEESVGLLKLRNAAKRNVFIEFAADPDIVIREQMAPDDYRNVIAIEIKGGTDFSNIHNRIGEAEKSHRKARAERYTECWTVVNVARLNSSMAHRESPSTDRFYCLERLLDDGSTEHRDFRNRVISLTGIRG